MRNYDKADYFILGMLIGAMLSMVSAIVVLNVHKLL